jgi:hypothetical protein
MTKVVEFPKNKIVREANNEEVIIKAKQKSKIRYADDIIDGLVDIMIEDLEQQGVDTDDEFFLKDFSMTVDALRATIYRQFDIEHPLQKFIDENVTVIDRQTGKKIEKVEDLEEE